MLEIIKPARKMQQNFTENQIKFINFLARGKKNRKGQKFTMEQFAEIIGVHPATLYRWQELDGFGNALMIATQKQLAPLVPELQRAVTGKAFDSKKYKQVDIPAANLALKLMGMVIDKSESKIEADVTADVTLRTTSDAELDAIIAGG